LNRASILVAVSIIMLLAALEQPAGGAVKASDERDRPVVVQIEDVTRFFKIYDGANGHPTADQLQHDYLDQGTEGLHTFAQLRNITGARIADTLAKNPEIYADAKRCMIVLPQARERIKIALSKLADIYPDAKFPSVTIAVGRGKPVGVGSPVSGVMIGLEALCGVTYFDSNVEDRFVHVIAHEYIHVQQVRALVDDDQPTVLEGSLIEGAAEFMAERISGAISDPGVWAEAKGRETKIETSFVPDEDNTDLSNWLYNGTIDKAGDLGYWVGYRIVKSYYQHAADKGQAIRDILQMSDPKAFLAKSGWYPGIRLGK
jgi:hypothetical protein